MSVTALPRFNIESVVDGLRQLANLIETGERPVVRCVVCAELPDGFTDYHAFGPDPFPRAHAAGLCFGAATDILNPNEEYDDE